jgi:hypothetical protein
MASATLSNVFGGHFRPCPSGQEQGVLATHAKRVPVSMPGTRSEWIRATPLGQISWFISILPLSPPIRVVGALISPQITHPSRTAVARTLATSQPLLPARLPFFPLFHRIPKDTGRR